VFIAPFINHGIAVRYSSKPWLLYTGVEGEIVMFWCLFRYVRKAQFADDPPETTDFLISRCRTILACSGALTCLWGLSRLYDGGALPYPFQRARIHDNFTQFNGCYGTSSGNTPGGFTGPIPPVVDPPRPSKPPQPQPDDLDLSGQDFLGSGDGGPQAGDPGAVDPNGGQPKPEPKSNPKFDRPLGEDGD
jgi:hypothetical protein